MVDKVILDKIIKYFKNKAEVEAVYLYGSQAKGTATKGSDIDLGVVMINYEGYQGFGIPQVVFAQDLSKITGDEVEVQDLNACSIEFAHRVLAEGKLLIANDEKQRIEFEEKILRNYFDLKPALDEYYECLSKIAKKGELHVRYT